MKIIIALLLASFVSAFQVPNVSIGFAVLARAAKFDLSSPKIFEREAPSTAKDAFPIEQGERRLLQCCRPEFMDFDRLMIQCYMNWQSGNDYHDYYPGTPLSTANGRCDNIIEEYKATWTTSDYANHFGCGNCEWIIKNAKLESMYFCDCLSSCSFENPPSRQTPQEPAPGAPVVAVSGAGCDDACKPGGTYTGPGDPAGCTETYCDIYAPGAPFYYRCDPANAHHHYALEECAKTCDICPGSSGNSRSSNASLSIIIPVVIAAVLLVAAVLYLVRKRRVAAATPDEAPQLDTEVQVEA